MYNISLISKKIRNSFINHYYAFIYYTILICIICASIASALFPYQAQSLFYRCVLNFITRQQTIRVILPDNDYDRALLKSLTNELKKPIHKKIIIKEIEYRKNTLPEDILQKGGGDLTILSSITCMDQRNKIQAISSAGEKACYIIAPKNYNFTEFQMLAGKRIGLMGDISTGRSILERLIQFYHFDIPPEVYKQKIYDIEKSFSNGDIEAVCWVEGIHASSVRELLSKPWYQTIPVLQIHDFSKSLPGLYVKNASLPSNNNIEILCVKNILVVSNKVSNFGVREIVKAWFSPEVAFQFSGEYNSLESFKPPPFLIIHPIALAFFNQNKSLTHQELITLTFSLFSLLIALLFLKPLINIFSQRKYKPYREELEKRWEEIRALKYQWETGLSYEEILIRVRQLKSVYNWAIESYKQRFISENEVALLCLSILQQLLEFNERYFEYIQKKQTIAELTSESPYISQKEYPLETSHSKTTPPLILDEKDKYLKTSVLSSESKGHEQQMLLFNPDEEVSK